MVCDPMQDKTLKPKRKEKPVRAYELVTEFKVKLNKYGFIHVPKKRCRLCRSKPRNR